MGSRCLLLDRSMSIEARKTFNFRLFVIFNSHENASYFLPDSVVDACPLRRKAPTPAVKYDIISQGHGFAERHGLFHDSASVALAIVDSLFALLRYNSCAREPLSTHHSRYWPAMLLTLESSASSSWSWSSPSFFSTSSHHRKNWGIIPVRIHA